MISASLRSVSGPKIYSPAHGPVTIAWKGSRLKESEDAVARRPQRYVHHVSQGYWYRKGHVVSVDPALLIQSIGNCDLDGDPDGVRNGVGPAGPPGASSVSV